MYDITAAIWHPLSNYIPWKFKSFGVPKNVFWYSKSNGLERRMWSFRRYSNQYLNGFAFVTCDPSLKVVVAITGASGTVYGCRLLEKLRESSAELQVIVTETALEILNSP